MNSTNISDEIIPSLGPSINPEVLNFFYTFNLLVVGLTFCVFGIAANGVTIVNFKRQGFQDGVNVTLTALALSDIGSLASQIAVNISGSSWIRQEDWFILKNDLAMPFYYAHEYFMRVSGVITSFAAFERCLCVSLPLKVKWLINRNVSVLVNGTAFCVLILTLIAPFKVFYFGEKFSREFNRTFIGLLFNDTREEYMLVYYFIAFLFVPYATISFLVLSTAVLVRKLTLSAHWRKTRSNEVSVKERRLITMLMTISLMFIICTVPQAVLTTATNFIRALAVDGPLFQVFKFTSCFTGLLETVNCSTSIFVYYKMSSRFRTELKLMFPILKTRET